MKHVEVFWKPSILNVIVKVLADFDQDSLFAIKMISFL